MRAWVPVLLLSACVRTTPQPPPAPVAPPPIHVPEGCLEPLGGAWVHANDPAYRYVGDDDGGALVLTVFYEPVIDAGFVPRRFRDAGVPDTGPEPDAGAPDAGPPAPAARVELNRTAQGFVGHTVATLTHPSGRACEARFPTTVLRCADGGLWLETQSATALGDACQAPARPGEQLRQQHQLVRPDAG